jgi:hypothetical protein
MGCTANTHGTANAWRKHGCTCPEARAAYLRQHKRTRVRVELEGPLRVDKTGTVRRIRALQAVGWPLRVLAAKAGYTTVGALSFLSRPAGKTVHVDTARLWRAIYDELCTEDGPGDVRTARWARERGWAAPEAWLGLDMDHPATRPAQPLRGRPRGRPRVWDEARLRDVAFLRESGVPDEQIAHRMGFTQGAMRRALDRARNRPATLAG